MSERMETGEGEGGLFKLKASIRSGPTSNLAQRLPRVQLWGRPGASPVELRWPWPAASVVLSGEEGLVDVHKSWPGHRSKSGLLIRDGGSIGHEYIQVNKNWMMLVHGSGHFNTYSSTPRLHKRHELAEMVDPSLKGTLNVLGSCAKAPSVKRVVLTASMAAVAFNGRARTPDVVVDETWFSDSNVCKDLQCRKADEIPFVSNHQVSKKRAKSLGADYILVEESIKPSRKL